MANKNKNKTMEKKQRPAVPNPHDPEAKKKLNPLADDINFIDDRGVLVCGARKKRGQGFCRSHAGAGTDHRGYGRCKYCGGRSTGPKTEEGRQKAAVNARKHGLYSGALRGRESEVYENLTQEKTVNLEHEIYFLKAKIVAYLERKKEQWEKTARQEGEAAADEKSKVWYATGEQGLGVKSYYHAGTIEDKPLIRALETLGRLVDKHAKLNPSNSDDLINQLNSELRAASHGKVSISWGGPAQERVESPKD